MLNKNNSRKKLPWVCKNYIIVIDDMTISCVQHCDPMDYTIHGILWARIPERVAFPYSSGSSQPRDWPQVFHIAGRFFSSWITMEAQEYWSGFPFPSPGDLPDTGIEPGPPALQADSLPTELQRKPLKVDSYHLSHKGSSRILDWVAYPFSRDLPNPGIEPGSPAL